MPNLLQIESPERKLTGKLQNFIQTLSCRSADKLYPDFGPHTQSKDRKMWKMPRVRDRPTERKFKQQWTRKRKFDHGRSNEMSTGARMTSQKLSLSGFNLKAKNEIPQHVQKSNKPHVNRTQIRIIDAVEVNAVLRWCSKKKVLVCLCLCVRPPIITHPHSISKWHQEKVFRSSQNTSLRWGDHHTQDPLPPKN